MTEWTACPDPECLQVAEVVDRYWCEGSPGAVVVATHCANGHRYYGIDAQTLRAL